MRPGPVVVSHDSDNHLMAGLLAISLTVGTPADKQSFRRFHKCADVDKGGQTLPDKEPAGMLESCQVGDVCLCPCTDATQDSRTDGTTFTSSSTTTAHDVSNTTASLPGDKTAETSLESPDVKDKDEIEEKSQTTAFRKCRIGNSDPGMEQEFLRSAAAQAVRYMIGDDTETNEKLLQALTVIRRKAGDCGVYPKNAQQLLEAVDSLNSETSTSEPPGELPTLCSRCIVHQDQDSAATPSENHAAEDRIKEEISSDEHHHVPTEEHVPEHHHVNAPKEARTEDLRSTQEEFQPAEITDKPAESAEHNRREEAEPFENAHRAAAEKLQETGDSSSEKQKALARYKLLLAENRRLKKRQLCRLCLKLPANATLLPCGHLVYCLDCAQSLSHCGVCRKEILGDVKTFLS
ncbi:hypothetical protein BaRGS_00016094 [Batillaria attramentaria]|uniref:RING-type domain-containing protein n=1 Tax=Batillaria attramentaria TaxID=370345 RepID=A0ABD0KZT9_9CAEN